MFRKDRNATLLLASVFTIAGCGNIETDTGSITRAEIKDEKVDLNANDGRLISLRVLTPENCNKCPLVIFSHGANAAFDRYDALLIPLAKAGYRVAVPNHTDSEDHVDREAYTAADWLPTRIEDYNVIAANYETRYRVAAGHSFGALIAQIAGGAEIPLGLKIAPAYAPEAVLAYSPPGPIPNYIDAAGWAKIDVPLLVTTGTTDIVPMMAEEWDLHLVSYDAAPKGRSFALIYDGMDHYMDGAYGRETTDGSAVRERAMSHLTKTSTYFLSSVKDGGKISSQDWETQKRDFVDARAK